MAQTNYTPIQLYYSTTAAAAPTAGNLASGELAININDGKLFYKDNAGVVQTLATKAATGGTFGAISVTSETNSGTLTLSGGTANGVAYLNGSKALTTGSALTFDGSTFTAKPTNSQFVVGATFAKIENLAGASANLIMADTTDSGTIKNIGSSIAFLNSSSEGMRLTSTGLGIGTSSPSQKLDVTGSARITTSVYSTSFINTSNGTSYFTDASTGNGLYVGGSTATPANTVRLFTNGSEQLRLDSAGNLGLGVTPSAWGNGGNIQLGGANIFANIGITYGANAYYNGGWKYITTGYGASYQNQFNGQHQFFTSTGTGTAGNAITFTQAMTLDASGKLFLNKTTGSGRLNVQQTGSEDVISITLGSGGSAFTVSSSGVSSTLTAAYYITSSGFAGQITCSGTTTIYSVTSDHRLKTVLGNVSGSGERIDALQPIDYEWKADGKRTRGFLAHKFQEVYPNSVVGEKDAVDAEGKPVYQTMQSSTSEVIADLVAEIQSLRKRLATLEAK